MRLFVVILLGGVIVFFPSLAHAHGTIRGLTGFANGLVHPVLVPGQLLALIGLGLALGQQGYEGLRLHLYLFTGSLVVGLLLSRLVNISPLTDSLALGAALIAGLVVALQPSKKQAVFLLPLSFVTGILVGAGSGISPLSFWQSMQAFTGSGVAAFVLVFYFAGLAGIIYADWPDWLKVGVRTAGSWIAAIALLVLALEFVELPASVASAI